MENLETKAKEMFSKLKEHMGDAVIMQYWTYGSYCEEVDTLLSVDDFERVRVGYVSTPFVGYGTAVISIKTMDGISLYEQPFNEPYDERDDLNIIEVKRSIFGDEIANEALEKYNERQRRKEESERKEQEEIAKFKESGVQKIIQNTIPYISDESKDSFVEMVHNNSNSSYGILVIKMTSELLIAIGEGMSFEEAIKKIADKKYGTSGYAMGYAANIIAHCSIKGEEFRKYWNGLYGVSEEKDTVNPAILVLSRKE